MRRKNYLSPSLASVVQRVACVWHVVGLQRSIREWAMRQGWGGRPVRTEQAQGILMAALGCWRWGASGFVETFGCG